MAVCEYDILEIPEKYKRMSLAEIEKEEEKILQKIKSQDHAENTKKQNKNNIVFNF